MSNRFDAIDHQTQRIIDALLDGGQSAKVISREVREQTVALSQLVSRMETINQQEHRKTRALIVNKGVTIDGLSDLEQRVTTDIDLLDISQEDEDKVRLAVAENILDSLQYPTMTHRYEEIVEAYSETCDWIFREPDSEAHPWSSFKDWLSRGDGIYWVNGKAGSGKSTLMRYIFDDARTSEYLQKCSKDVLITTATFFFWNSGSVEQKSQAGLLRALLFQILDQQPYLIPTILPWSWGTIYSRSVARQPQVGKESWTVTKLMKAFKLLAQQRSVDVKLCLFIDGLDEFAGDHEHLALFLKDIVTSENVKVCLSSRPWVIFEDNFRGYPTLRLQDQTQNDIQHYVHGRTYNNSAFRSLAEREPKKTLDLIKEIVRKADGVFLWVKIVVESLLRGVRNRDGIPDLQQRLRMFPRELGPLYEHLLGHIEPLYSEWASKAFQILRVARAHRDHLGDDEESVRPLTIWDLYLALHGEAMFDGPKNVSALDERLIRLAQTRSEFLQDGVLRREETRHRLTARCAGLLECWDYGRSNRRSNRVQYLHRTARDYIEDPAVWKQLLTYTAKSPFNPHLSMMRSCILRLEKGLSESTTMSSDKHTTVVSAMIYAHYAEKATRKPQVVALDHLAALVASMTPSIPEDATLDPLRNRLLGQEQVSFFTFAVLWDLPAYMRDKITEFNRLSRLNQPKECARLLHYALRWSKGDDGNRYPRASLEMVALLLRNGESPNQLHRGHSPWESALAHLYNSDWDDAQDPDQKEFVNILGILLKTGANPRACYETGHGLLSAADISSMKLSESFPVEVNELIEEMESRGAKNKEVATKKLGLRMWLKR
jgi:hypothetical protein